MITNNDMTIGDYASVFALGMGDRLFSRSINTQSTISKKERKKRTKKKRLAKQSKKR